MKRCRMGFLIALILVSQTGFCFDVSPTQVNGKVQVSPNVKISPDLIDSLFQDDHLVKGVEMMQVAPDGKRILSIRGDLTDPMVGDPVDCVKKCLMDHCKLFNITNIKDPYLLSNIRNEEVDGCCHLDFQMSLDGVKVLDAIISVHLGRDKRVNLISGSLPSVDEYSNQISIGRIQAIAAAKRAIGASSIKGTPKAELNILPIENSKGLMVFVVKLSSDKPLGDWEITIDADTGKEVSRLNQMNFSRNTGKGSFYLNHPLLGAPVTEELLHLTAHSLSGEFANVTNEDSDSASASNDVHIYDPSDTHFDEVNVYSLITRIHDYYKGLGFSKMDFPLRAVVHYGDSYDNAYFSPQSNSMAFGDGNRLNDLSKEETVCWHEYSHAVLNQIVRLNYSAESGAMNEGQADYFACSYSNDAKLGEYAVAKMGKPYLRIMTNSLHYPEDIEGEVHADGSIWGGVLWDVRAALGEKTSDKLIHSSFFYLKSGSPEFLDGANAIFTADKNLNNSENKEALAKVFQARGITTKSNYNGSVLDSKDLMRIGLFRKVHGE